MCFLTDSWTYTWKGMLLYKRDVHASNHLCLAMKLGQHDWVWDRQDSLQPMKKKWNSCPWCPFSWWYHLWLWQIVLPYSLSRYSCMLLCGSWITALCRDSKYIITQFQCIQIYQTSMTTNILVFGTVGAVAWMGSRWALSKDRHTVLQMQQHQEAVVAVAL